MGCHIVCVRLWKYLSEVLSVERENVLIGSYTTYSGVFSALIEQKARATSETGALSDLGALHRACGLNLKGEYDTARVQYLRAKRTDNSFRPSRRPDMSDCRDTTKVVRLLGRVTLGSAVSVQPGSST